MRKFGLIGYPLGHSFSKKFFTEKFYNEQITDCSYENFPLTGIDQLHGLIREETELQGLNVTIPYKSEIIKLLDNLSPEAEEIGAVNVIKITRPDNKIVLTGFNSDVTGIRDSLVPFLKDYVKSALILGSGGSSCAVSYFLRKSGIDFNIVSRSRKEGAIAYSDLSSGLLRDTYLIINTTPLGMFPDLNTKPDIDYSLLGSKHILFDLVYNPQETLFLKYGIQQGCTVIKGINMLNSQAEKSWEIWNDKSL